MPVERTMQNVSMEKRPSNTDTRTASMRSVSVSKGEKVNPTDNILSCSIKSNVPKQLTYYLGKGNNEGLIRRVMKCRNSWVECEDSTYAFINLKWQQDKKGYKYDRLVDSGLYRGVLNQFEFHECLCNKEFLFRNLEQYCHKQGLDVWAIVPPTYILNLNDECNMQVVKQLIDSYEKYYPKDLKGRVSNNYQKDIQQTRQKLRRLFNNSNLKKVLLKPPPFRSCFVDEQGGYLWIVKPTFLNRGRGIQVFSKLESLYKFISDNINGYFEKALSKTEHEVQEKLPVDYIKRNSQKISQAVFNRDPNNREVKERREIQNTFDGNQYIRVIPRGPALIRTDHFLVQKYLERPMLLLNRKFDIRIWVLVAPNLKAYVFKEGYVRLSSLQYQCKDSSDNVFMHLTNNAVQKFSEGYGKVADGNQLSFSELKKSFCEKGLDFQSCKSTIYDHICKTLLAVNRSLNPLNRKYTFEIFGYDFMIDQTGYPWLIEVNNNPCIEESSKLLATLLPRMIDDAFRIALDSLFYGSISNGRFPVSGYTLSENMWHNLQIDNK